MDYGRTIDVHRNEGESESEFKSAINHLKHPYLCAIWEDDWEGLKRFYQMNPQELNSPMTVHGDTAIHIAASCSTQSQGKKILEFLISLLSTYEEKCYAVRLPKNNGNNALHEVAASGNLEAAEFLVSHFNKPPQDITSTDHDIPLLETRNQLGETPLYRAAAHGHTSVVQFYAHKLKEENPDNLRSHFHRKDKKSILHIAVIGQHFETALWLLKNYQHLAQQREDKGLTSLQLLAQMPTAFETEFQPSRWKMLIYKCLPVPDGDLVTPNQKDDVESSLDINQPRQCISPKKLAVILKVYSSLWDFLAKGKEGTQGIIYKIWKEKKNQKSQEKLITLLVKKDYSWERVNNQATTKTVSLGSEVINDGGGTGGGAKVEPTKSDKRGLYDYTPLLIATITGIKPIVEEILEQHPQAAEHVSHNEQTILHLAVKYRQKDILKLIKTKAMMSRLNEGIDADGNTILHQAADMSYYSVAVSRKLMGPAMLLQEDLLWMQRVKKYAPPHYAMHHNKKGQTAEELFNEDHNDLLKKAQEWIKKTAEACSTVAVLVAAVVFAAAYAIPGGNNEENGRPNLEYSPIFWLFTGMDVLAISFSLSSVAFFLSILSSPHEYPQFCHSLPRRLTIGFVMLFLSMATTMLAFIATIFLLIHVEKEWTKSLLYSVAFFPVPLFGLLQFPMFQFFKDIFKRITKFFRHLLPFDVCSKKRSTRGKRKTH